jgi:hypothetical protein
MALILAELSKARRAIERAELLAGQDGAEPIPVGWGEQSQEAAKHQPTTLPKGDIT